MPEKHSGSQGYDLIGDVHGCAHTLEVLLHQLGYRKHSGVWQHPRRQVVFLGDIVDRGPRIRESLHLVRDMVEHGAAKIVMGNHEYNALAYCTRARPGSGQSHVRPHTERNQRQIRETFEQFEHHDREWQDFLQWFYTLPLFLDLEGLRVVHACWDHQLIRQFREKHPDGCMDEDFLHASMASESFAGKVTDNLLRGTDMRLPEGRAISSKDGYTRHFFRTKFWASQPRTYGDIVFQPDPLPDDIARRPLPEEARRELLQYGTREPPVFVGHYWMQGKPEPITPNVACLDYSAVKYGKLVAYRWSGEQRLQQENFAWVNVERNEAPGGLPEKPEGTYP